jgi:hypothetical protein
MRQNLTKTTAVAAVIGVASCLFPAIAQAQLATDQAQAQPTPQPSEQPQVVTPPRRRSLLQFSGDPNQEANVRLINFSLDTSVQDINSDDSVGEFRGAVPNFTVDSVDDAVPDLSLSSGTLKTSRLTFNANNEVDPIIVDYSNPNNIKNISRSDLSQGGTSNDWLRYDVTFPDSPATLALFLPSNDPSLINSLSGFNDFLSSNPQIQAVVSRPDVDRVESRTAKVVESNPDPNRKALNFRVATVPEPTATASLLGVGTLGAITLLKRNRRQSKSV